MYPGRIFIRPAPNPVELDNIRPYLRKQKIKKIYGDLGKPTNRI
mgnify:CR=1 FL=1